VIMNTVTKRCVGLVAAALMLTLVVGCGNGNRPDSAPASRTMNGSAAGIQAPQAPPPAPSDETKVKADIVTTGTVQMTVGSPTEAADKFVAATVGAGGHVDSRTEQSGHGRPTVELTLRIPSAKVEGVLAEIGKLGTVDSIQINHEDVTAQRVDLDARIKALQTSVDRLLDLMSKAASTSTLLEAENALTERQADLDSLKSQRATLGDQIAYSTITVNLGTEPEVIAEGGFFGAVKDGWHALVSFGGALAAMIGFLLPWTPVFALLVGAFWLLRRRQLRRHPKVVSVPPQPPAPPVEPTPSVETSA
jgi:Ca-activated chloride channel family protein